ncbi:hypothetical protein P5V34_05060 [Mycobacteroides abscessus subsp. abscessus]|jgi:hypothetical protein|uniref:hypothetical protein n=1 Tax=Mycobacteroides abscessus TaxID=36809 RepID=UPI00266DC027|nr:hypothetical protein [Mycobacteroides abscessus]MDO3013354.1 hypothetical protein [Mycobacteroides abscessus subsp. abscessus]
MDFSPNAVVAVVFALVLGLACVAFLVHCTRDGWAERQLRKRREHDHAQRQQAADAAELELRQDLQNWGIPESLLISHRTVQTSYDGVVHAEYDLPRDEFVRRVQQATRVHQTMIASLGGRPAALTSAAASAAPVTGGPKR